MRAVELRELGVEHLQVVERADPEPGPGQVRVRMRYASLNFRDNIVARGGYGKHIGLPLIPLSDGAGVIDAVGDGVTDLKVGDRVLACYFQGWAGGAPTRARLATSLGGPLDGTLSELRVFPEGSVVRLPDYLSDDEAATLPCAGVTAYNALSVLDHVGPEHTVLVQGTGGVSIFALQLAKLAGARVIVTSSSDDKLVQARALGADETINYRNEPAWGERARALTDGVGVDHVIEVGGAGTLEQSVHAVAIGGTISLIGVLAGSDHALRLPLVFLRQVRLQGVVVGSRDATERMLKAMAQHRMKPVIDPQRFEMANIQEAYAYLGRGGHFGKVVVTIT